MSFLAPLGLLALLALPIIVVLHLLRERRRRVVVPSLLLWRNLTPRPDPEQRRRLPLTWLLLMHLLVAGLLALALAQPQWLNNLLGGQRHVAVVIDTSTSMAARDGGSTRLEQARNRARSLINGLSGNDTLSLIAAGPQARVLASGTAESATALLAALETVQVEGSGTDLSGGLTLAQAALANQGDGRVVVLSDSATPNLEREINRTPRTRPIDWQQIGGNTNNQAIVTLASRAWNSGGAGGRSSVQVYARVANYSSGAVTSQLRLFGDDQLLDTRDLNMLENGESELTWTLPTGIRVLRAELTGNDALPADNSASLSLAAARPINTLLVSASPGALERALRAVPGLNVTVVPPADYGAAQQNARPDLTIFDGALPADWPVGGVLVVNPPPGAERPAGSPLTIDGQLVDLNREGQREPVRPVGTVALFDGLSLDSVNFAAARRVEVPPWATVQLAAGDLPLILRGQAGQSEIAIWTFDLTSSTLPSRLAFPLLVARTVRSLTPAALPGSLLAGESLPVRLSPRTDSLELREPDGQTRQIAVTPGGAVAPLSLGQPGVYTIVERAGADVLFEGQLAVNAGSPIESDLRPRPVPPGLDRAATPTGGNSGVSVPDWQPFWFGLVMLALLVMLIEWAYVHRGRRVRVEN
ncbi:MAG: VWA domain-containing protein [Chloroflexaceae bacterium]|nr:VWA domain-containing protein [Chloroflexaceae bacterium]